MADVEIKSLPENAYQPLKPGEIYMPLVPATMAPPEVTWRAVLWGTLLCIIFSVASAYSTLKVGQGMEAALHRAGEHDHHGHGRRLRRRGVRRRLHPAGALHSPPRPAPGTDHLHLPGRRLPGRALPYSAAALLCTRDARQVSISRGHGDHRSPCHRRERRIASQTTAAGHRHRRDL